MTDLEFPSIQYFYHEQRRNGARVELVPAAIPVRFDLDKFLAAIDESTLLVPISQVLFRSAYIVDARAIIEKAHRVGAHVILDAFSGCWDDLRRCPWPRCPISLRRSTQVAMRGSWRRVSLCAGGFAPSVETGDYTGWRSGSFNLDPRSAVINTEAGLYIESPELAKRLTAYMAAGVVPANSYRVFLDPKGDIVWETERNGQRVRYRDEPETGFRRQFVADLWKLLPMTRNSDTDPWQSRTWPAFCGFGLKSGDYL